MVETCLAAWSELMRKLKYFLTWPSWPGLARSDVMMGSCWGDGEFTGWHSVVSSAVHKARMGISRFFGRQEAQLRRSNTKRGSSRSGRTSTRRSTRSVRSKARSTSKRASQRHKKVWFVSLPSLSSSFKLKYFRPSGREGDVKWRKWRKLQLQNTFSSHLNTESCLEFLVSDPCQPQPQWLLVTGHRHFFLRKQKPWWREWGEIISSHNNGLSPICHNLITYKAPPALVLSTATQNC